MTRPLLDALGPDELRALAADLASGRLSLPVDGVDLNRHLGGRSLGTAVADLNGLAARGLGPAQAAFVLELLAHERQLQRAVHDRVELVWTGPETVGAQARDTWTVTHDLFSAARSSVLISSFTIHQGSKVFAALADNMRANPSLRVRFFVNIEPDRDAILAPAELLSRYLERFRNDLWHGPRLPELFYDPRTLDSKSRTRTSLHAKCIVVDELHALVSSANFTEAAQERNIEAGVLVRDPGFARALSAQFETLVHQGILKRLRTA